VIGSAGAIELPKSKAEQKAEKIQARRSDNELRSAGIITVSAQVGQ